MDSHRALRHVLGLAAVTYAITLHAQAPGSPAFEVASIRQNLTWTPDEAPPGPDGTSAPPPPSSDSGSLYTAVQEQLGLKLDAQRGSVDVLVIDSVERPIQD